MKAFSTYATELLLFFLIWPAFIRAESQVHPQAPLRIQIDASQVSRRLLHSHLEIPVTGTTVTLSYPLWNPGDHAPFQHVGQIANLTFRARGRVLNWRRDLVSPDVFHIQLPVGAKTLQADFDFLLSLPGDGLSDFSRHLLVIRWNLYTLYIASQPVSKIPVVASVILPTEWHFGCAIPEKRGITSGGHIVHLQKASLETLIDSPLLTGQFMRRIELTQGQTYAHEMDVAADTEADLPKDEEVTRNYKRLVDQAQLMFGAEHYRRYVFLVAVSDYTNPGSGFEHSESSDDRVPSQFFRQQRFGVIMGDLLPHEYVHSWNGKYRRPADLYPEDYQHPEKTDLLWVYESLTDYLGNVLASRAGFRSQQDSLEYWAAIAAKVDHETGRTWRNMQDTADSVPLTMDELFLSPPGWDSWLRMLDYYDEGALIWLEVNEIINQQTQGKKSLDNFCRLFFLRSTVQTTVKTYREQDVFAALNKVAPYDWKGFFHERLTSHASHAPLRGLEMSGWTLSYSSRPNSFLAVARPNGLGSMMNSIGLAASTDGNVSDVLRGGPSDKAGLVPGMKIILIDSQPWSPEGLIRSVAGSEKKSDPIRLRAEMLGVSQEFAIDYHGGLRYPHLERIQNRHDHLVPIFEPLTAEAQ